MSHKTAAAVSDIGPGEKSTWLLLNKEPGSDDYDDAQNRCVLSRKMFNIIAIMMT